MNKIKDGGPAFPQEGGIDQLESPYLVQGMSLRDYFAAKAMQAMLSNFGWMTHAAQEFPDVNGEELVPQMAFEIADAMLKARQS